MTNEEGSVAPEGYGTVTPWIISPDSAGLIAFLEQALDAQELPGSRMADEVGVIKHVEVKIGDSIVMLFDSRPGWPVSPAFLRVYVDDAARVCEKALTAGARQVTDVTEMFWGDRIGRVRDPYGNLWWIQSRVLILTPEEMMTRMNDPVFAAGMEYVMQSLAEEMGSGGSGA